MFGVRHGQAVADLRIDLGEIPHAVDELARALDAQVGYASTHVAVIAKEAHQLDVVAPAAADVAPGTLTESNPPLGQIDQSAEGRIDGLDPFGSPLRLGRIVNHGPVVIVAAVAMLLPLTMKVIFDETVVRALLLQFEEDLSLGAEYGKVRFEHVCGAGQMQPGLVAQRRVGLDRPPPADGLVVFLEVVALGGATAMYVNLHRLLEDFRIGQDLGQAERLRVLFDVCP